MKLIRQKTFRRIRRRFVRLYGDRAELLMERLYMMVGRYGVGRQPAGASESWNENDVVLITYADMVRSPDERPLVTLDTFCEKHLAGAIKTVHILPFCPWSSDDGFSVKAYRTVEPEYGKWDDIESLGGKFQLMFDLVLNHCSSESSWFQDFVTGVQPWRDFFIEMDPETDLSAVVRPRTSDLLTKAPTPRGEAFVWTTFSEDQVDLNWSNPDVFFEFLDILFFYCARGARILRLDAVAFLWKEVGTDCLHRPETHEVVKLFRDILSIVSPGTLLLTETNVPHRENVSYLGNGDEAHMVYQFTLPPLLLFSLLKGDCSRLGTWLDNLPALPDTCTFLNFTASHDGIGVRPLDGYVDEEERAWLVGEVEKRGAKVNSRSLSDGTQVPYELNITYASALSEPGDEALGIERFLCSQAVALSLRGMPAVYFHSLMATPNNVEGYEKDGQNRTLNRKKWDLDELEGLLADPASTASVVFERYQLMLRRRANHPAFHPNAAQEVLDYSSDILAFRRTSKERSEIILCLFNFTAENREIDLAKIHADLQIGETDDRSIRNLLSGLKLEPDSTRCSLAPYEAAWLTGWAKPA